MSGYVITNFQVTDAELYASYAARASATIAAHGGEYLARGGATHTLEGEVPAGRVVVIRFPSVEAATAWYYSPEYAELRAIRQKAAHGSLFITTGLDEA